MLVNKCSLVLKFLDIRIKIILSEPTEAQIEEVQRFRERYEISHSKEVIELRKCFCDLLNEVIYEI